MHQIGSEVEISAGEAEPTLWSLPTGGVASKSEAAESGTLTRFSTNDHAQQANMQKGSSV